MAEYVLVLDDDSRAQLLHALNTELANRTPNVTTGPLLRARDALTWAITTEAAEARTELALADWWMTASGNLECDPDWADAAPHVVHGMRNAEPPTDERNSDG